MLAQNDIGLRPRDIGLLLAQSPRNVHRLRNHPDPAERYPPPDLIINGRPIWKLSTHQKYERRQKQNQLTGHAVLTRPPPPQPKPKHRTKARKSGAPHGSPAKRDGRQRGEVSP